MPTKLVLPMCIGVGGCGWSNSCIINRMIFAYFAFKNREPNLASAAQTAMNFNILTREFIVPFKRIGFPLRDFFAVRYDASECTCKIISDS